MKSIDLTGKKFGRWTVIERVDNNKQNKTAWKCECDCKTIKIVDGSSLTRGNSKSCGCFPRPRTVIEMVGEKFGRLLVIEEAGRIDGLAAWLCKCDCGTQKIIRGSSLRKGQSRSCGCLTKEVKEIRHDNMYPPGEAGLNNFICQNKRGAQRRGYDWELTKEQVMILTKRSCHYCDQSPSQIKKSVSLRGHYIYNGIDRIDNSKGYTIDNVVPCCKTCNYAKHKLSQGKFKEWISAVHNHWIGQEIPEWY